MKTEMTEYCPVKEGQINSTDCLTICDVVDKMFKPCVLPPGIVLTEEKIQKCKHCKWYLQDIEDSKK